MWIGRKASLRTKRIASNNRGSSANYGATGPTTHGGDGRTLVGVQRRKQGDYRTKATRAPGFRSRGAMIGSPSAAGAFVLGTLARVSTRNRTYIVRNNMPT